MTKTDIKVARVFFDPENGPAVEKVTVITLESHVGNVVKLVKNFRRDFYPAFKDSKSETHNLLIRAAQRHDEAKPNTFRITYQGRKGNGRKSLGYSFAGHRFRVSDPDRYVELLIRLHHEFSVEGVVEAQAELVAETESQDARFKNFPLDLYILEMCDQIEAELETYAITGKVQPRVFMDFHSQMPQDGKVEVNPYPFRDSEIPLTVAYYEFDLPMKQRRGIAKALTSDNPIEGQTQLKEIIEKVYTYTKCQQKEMILCQAY